MFSSIAIDKNGLGRILTYSLLITSQIFLQLNCRMQGAAGNQLPFSFMSSSVIGTSTKMAYLANYYGSSKKMTIGCISGAIFCVFATVHCLFYLLCLFLICFFLLLIGC